MLDEEQSAENAKINKDLSGARPLAGIIHTLTFLNAIRTHPLTSVVLLALIIVSAFMGGMIIRIGFGFVPIIDKSSLLLQLAFYASVLSVVLNLLGSAIESIGSQNEFMSRLLVRVSDMLSERFPMKVRSVSGKFDFEEEVYEQLMQAVWADGNRIFAQVISGFLSLLFVASLIIGLVGFGAVFLRLPIGSFILAHWYVWGLWALFIIFLAGAVLPPIGTRLPRLAFLPPVNRLSFVWARVAFLLALVASGMAWVNYLVEVAPQVGVEIADVGMARGTLLLAATDGIIVHLQGHTGVEYLPWSRIDRITANPTEAATSR